MRSGGPAISNATAIAAANAQAGTFAFGPAGRADFAHQPNKNTALSQATASMNMNSMSQASASSTQTSGQGHAEELLSQLDGKIS